MSQEAIHGYGVSDHELVGSSTWSPSGKNERMCANCRRNFWAWDTGRDRCYLCEPLDPVETRRVLVAIGMGHPEHLSLRLAAPAPR